MIRYLKNLIHYIEAVLATVYYRYPAKSLTVIGVTGTDGKTTTTHLIYEILKAAGEKAAMVSTIEAVINSEHIDTGFHVTSPSPFLIQKLLRKAVDGSCRYFVLEVTSHALDQFRTLGTSIDIAIITNISHEHLDYHKTLENYRNTKAKIMLGADHCILNADDINYNFLKTYCSGEKISFGIDKQADYTLKSITFTPQIPGKFNLYNCLAAFAVAKILNIDEKKIKTAIEKFSGISGRMEEVKSNKPFKVYIDFAHKPNALEQALKTARTLTKGKLIAVFGCAGLRDRLKRPMMGSIASRLADYVILTAEDPRTEDVRDIINQISEGCLKEKAVPIDKRDTNTTFVNNSKSFFWKIPDRQEAINYAIRKLAKKDDLVLVCGKGHEKSLAYGRKEYPWNEKNAIEKAIYGTIKTSK